MDTTGEEFSKRLREISNDRSIGARLQKIRYIQKYHGELFTIEIRRGDFLNCDNN